MHTQLTKKRPPVKQQSRQPIPPPPLNDRSYPVRPVMLPAWMVDRLEEMNGVLNWKNGVSGLVEGVLYDGLTEKNPRHVGEAYIESIAACQRRKDALHLEACALGKKWLRRGIKPASAYSDETPVMLDSKTVARMQKLAEVADWLGGLPAVLEEFCDSVINGLDYTGSFFLDGSTHSDVDRARIRAAFIRLGKKWDREDQAEFANEGGAA